MPEVSHISPITASTRICAVYGHPIKHSASPAMHNAAMAAMGLNWRYVAYEVHPDDLKQAIEGARAMRFVGLNLTVPHKLFALDMVDWLDESARCWGAVNTIRFESQKADGTWHPIAQGDRDTGRIIRTAGFNTDADAIIRSLREDLDLVLMRGASVLVLGAGGAGKAAAKRLAAEGVGSLYLVNRTLSKAEALAAEIRAQYPQREVYIGYPGKRIDLVLNATSAGLSPHDPLPYDQAVLDLRNVGAVYDMIYKPAETQFLRVAKEAGCRVANGLGMLLYQGARALELWSGKPVPIDVMRKALANHIYA